MSGERERMRAELAGQLNRLAVGAAAVTPSAVPPGCLQLSGAGEAEQRRTRAWLLAGLGVLLGLAALIWLALRPTPERAALDAWCATPPADALRFPRLGVAVRERGWVRSAPGMVDGPELFVALDGAAFGAVEIVDAAAWGTALAALKGLRWSGTSWISVPGGKAVARTVDEIGALLAATMPADAARAARIVLAGVPTGSAPDFPRRLLAESAPPARMLVRRFSGRRGVHAVAVGRPEYQMVDRAFTGLVVRFDDPGWPPEWRVLELRPEAE